MSWLTNLFSSLSISSSHVVPAAMRAPDCKTIFFNSLIKELKKAQIDNTDCAELITKLKQAIGRLSGEEILIALIGIACLSDDFVKKLLDALFIVSHEIGLQKGTITCYDSLLGDISWLTAIQYHLQYISNKSTFIQLCITVIEHELPRRSFSNVQSSASLDNVSNHPSNFIDAGPVQPQQAVYILCFHVAHLLSADAEKQVAVDYLLKRINNLQAFEVFMAHLLNVPTPDNYLAKIHSLVMSCFVTLKVDNFQSQLEVLKRDRSFCSAFLPRWLLSKQIDPQWRKKVAKALFDTIVKPGLKKDQYENVQLVFNKLVHGIATSTAPTRKEAFKFWQDDQGHSRYLVYKIGQGSYSKAYWLWDFVEGLGGVFKNARRKSTLPNVIKTAQESLENEFQILSYIHSKSDGFGLQKLPLACKSLVVMTRQGTLKARFGTIGHAYKSDYFSSKWDHLDFDTILIHCYQLLNALHTLHSLRVLHGDIHFENIFIDDSLICHLGDFGGGCHVETTKLAVKDLVAGSSDFRPASHSYTCLNDLIVSKQMAKEAKLQEVIESEEKRDIFGLGTVVHTLFQKKMPYTLENGTSGFPYGQYREIVRQDITIPKVLKDLVRSMCHADMNLRPTAKEAFTIFDGYLQTQAGLYQRIMKLRTSVL